MRESFTQHKGNQVRGKPRESAVFVERCLTGKEIEQKGFLQVCVCQVQSTEVFFKCVFLRFSVQSFWRNQISLAHVWRKQER